MSVRAHPFRVAIPAGIAAIAAALLSSGTEAQPVGGCGGAMVTDIRHGVLVCIHASERPPPGIDLNRRPTTGELEQRRFGRSRRPPAVVGTAPGAAASAAGGSVACVGDGSDGNRVQAIYARASDVPDRSSSVASLIRQYAADADYQINVSAGQSGEGRRVRFVTQSCALSIASVTLSPSGDDSFSAMRAELKSKGFSRSDRKYLVWMDASVGICGLAELYQDDSASADNANNRGPSYARVDAPCWGYAEAHELLHTLGAVQGSAPNSSGAGHCLDENDTMCYVDTSGSAMSDTCPSLPSWQVDCSLDDYFNASSSPSNYLATHWNVADSSFLEGAPAPPLPPAIAVTAPASFYAGNAIGVHASVEVPPGRSFAVTWSSSRSDCKFSTVAATKATFYCPVTAAGGGQITARVTDSLGMSSSATKAYQLIQPSKRRGTVAGIGASKSKVSRRKPLKLTGKLVDRRTGKPVIGMRVTVYYRRAGTSSWRTAAIRTTDVAGRFTLTVRPARTTYYMFASWYTRTWASDKSNIKRIRVV